MLPHGEFIAIPLQTAGTEEIMQGMSYYVTSCLVRIAK